MLNQYSRMEFIYGKDALEALRGCHVAIFGLGGVGGSVCEALARSGVGAIDLIDDDRICLTNLNRQVLATRSSVGKYKVDAAEERIHDIDPTIAVQKYKTFYIPGEEGSDLDFSQWDYVVDAIDTVTGKLGIISAAKAAGVPVISCMGCGNRTDPSKLTVTDLYQTSMDPLARVMRRECRKRGITELTVVYSTEPAIRPLDTDNSCTYHCICPPGTRRKCTERRDIPGSSAFVPPAAGMLIASVIVRDLTHFSPVGRTKQPLPAFN